MNAVKIILTCHICANSTWCDKGLEYDYMIECLTYGELCYPEEMCHEVVNVHEDQ